MPIFLSSYQAPGGYFRPQQTLRLKSVVGDPIQVLPFFTLDYARSVSSVGNMTITVPSTIGYQRLAVDNRVEVWRSIEGGVNRLDMDTAWLVKAIKLSYDEMGKSYWEITLQDMKVVCHSRIVAYNQETSGALKTALSDNLMKAVMRENFGSGASAGRNIASYLTIQADTSLALSISKAMEYRNVDEVFGEVIEASLSTAKPVYFDIVMTGSSGNTPEFRTYINQRGSDRRSTQSGGIFLSPKRGNVGAFSVTDNYAEECTFIYAIGPGNLGARMIATASDATRIARSPFGRIEKSTQGSNSPVTASLSEEALSELAMSRSRKVVEGTILQNSRFLYGRDWGFGDRLTFKPTGEWSFDVRVDATHVSVSQQKETIEAYFRG